MIVLISNTQSLGIALEPSHTGLTFVSQILVISLPRRIERRRKMEQLRSRMQLKWSFIDAKESYHPSVMSIFAQVKATRTRRLRSNSTHSSTNGLWPRYIDAITVSDEPLDLSGSDLWGSSTGANTSESIRPRPTEDLTCAVENETILPIISSLPDHKNLTLSKMACWMSHVEAIRHIANGVGDAITLILEDDVDMEKDINTRLGGVWSSLPDGWDIVFLGQSA